MKYLISICIVACCVLAIAVSSVSAYECQMGKCDFMSGQGKMSERKGTDKAFFYKAYFILENASELGLSSDQIEKIKTLKYSVKKSLIKQDAEIKTIALDIKEALGKDEIDVSAVNKLIDQKYVLKANKAKESVDAYANLKKILTADQIEKLKEIHRPGMGGWHKGWKGNRGAMSRKGAMHEEGMSEGGVE